MKPLFTNVWCLGGMCNYVQGKKKMKTYFGGRHGFLCRMLGLEWDYCICTKNSPEHKDGSKISIQNLIDLLKGIPRKQINNANPQLQA